SSYLIVCCFFFQAEDGIRDRNVTGVQTCALPISLERKYHTSSLPTHSPFPSCARRPSTNTKVSPSYSTRSFTLVSSLPSVTKNQIGRASCRERVEKSVGEVSDEKKDERMQIDDSR